jgi:Spy/CpxP family protein refolding chaperone
MKKTTLTIAAIVAVLALAAVPFVYAGPGHRGQGGFGLERLAHAQKALGLSDQQVTQIKAIFKDVHTQNAQYRQQARGAFGDVMTTLLKNPNDLAAAQTVIDQQAQNERTMKMNLLAGASKALNVLTPEQRDKLAQLIAQRQQKLQQQF